MKEALKFDAKLEKWQNFSTDSFVEIELRIRNRRLRMPRWNSRKSVSQWKMTETSSGKECRPRKPMSRLKKPAEF